jgi:prevent-host-death family protein
MVATVMGERYYVSSMPEIAPRDLRNDTVGVLSRVQADEDIVITVDRKPLARVVPIAAERRAWLARTDLVRRISTAQADPGLRDDLARIADETTDDLGHAG